MKQHTRRSLPWAMAAAIASVVTAQAADYPSTVTSLGAVGYYRLNEATAVPGNRAINQGSAGPIGDAYYVNDSVSTPMHGSTAGALAGSSDGGATVGEGWIQTPFDASTNPQGSFTAEIWAQPTAEPAGLTSVMTFGHSQNGVRGVNGELGLNRSGWLLYQDNGASAGGKGWNFRMFNHLGINRSLTLNGGDVPTVGTWAHVVVSYDASTGMAYLYVNGELQSSGLSPGYAPNYDGYFTVGRRNDLAFTYSGIVDEVAVYNTVLSADVIKSHYQNGMSATPSPAYDTLVKQANPLLYYRLNEPVYNPSASPVASANSGTWGAGQNALVSDGVVMNQPGPSYPGFGANNKAAVINGWLGQSKDDPKAGLISIPAPSLNTDTVTFTAWIKRNGPSDDVQGWLAGGWAPVLFQRNGDGTATGFGFGDANDLRYHWKDTGYGFVPSPRMVVPDGVWSFVAASFSPTQTVLCLNGVLATNAATQAPHDFSIDPIYFGMDPSSTQNRRFDGAIDEVAIFDKALTGAQLQQLYAAGQMPPVISAQPVGPTGTLYEGMGATLSVTAIGGSPLSYQWKRGATALSGQTQATLSIANLKASDSGDYTVVITNPYGSATSKVVSLNVLAGPPILSKSPVAVAVYPGGTAKFSADAVGSTPITFQWTKDGAAIPGATNKSLTVSLVSDALAGAYAVVATNPNGSVTSATAALSVLPVTPNATAAILSSGPLAYWRLNESSGSIAYDSVGGFNGTFNPVTTKSGQAGPRPSDQSGFEASNSALLFDGNTSDVSCAPLNATFTSATIIAFIQPKGLLPTDFSGIVYVRGGGAPAAGLNLRPTSGTLGYNWNDNATMYNWDSALTPVTDAWNLVALVVEPEQATMYLDSGSGLQSAVNPTAHGIQSFLAATHIGTDPSGNRIFGGLIDEVAIFDHALTGTEIEAIRNAAFQNKFTAVPPSIVSSPTSVTAFVGDKATLKAGAAGTPPLSFQWTKDGVAIPGATAPTLSFASLTAADSGTYRFVVSSGTKVATSSPAVLSALPIPGAVNLPQDLVLHLRFDGDYQDASSRGNNATAVGSPTFVTGKIGSKAVSLKTVAGSIFNWVNVGTATDFSFTESDSFTVSFWSQYTDWKNDLPLIGNAPGSTYQQGWCFADSGGRIELSLVSTANSGTYVADPVPNSPIINDGAWHNVVAVVDRTAATASVYVDGKAVHQYSIAGLATLDYGNGLAIGQNPAGDYGVNGAGAIDDVGIWRRALTPIEARSIYFAGQAGNSFDSVETPKVTLSITASGGSVTVGWNLGTLQSADSPEGPWQNVSGASAPSYSAPASASAKFYRAKLN